MLYIVTPMVEFRFADVNFEHLDTSVKHRLFLQAFLGLNQLQSKCIVHGGISIQSLVIVSLSPPDARLAGSETMRKVEPADFKRLHGRDMVQLAGSLIEALLNAKNLDPVFMRGMKLEEHAKRNPEDAHLIQMLIYIFERGFDGSFTANEAVLQDFWDVARNSANSLRSPSPE